MEQVKDIILAMKNSTETLQKVSHEQIRNNEISIYKGETANPQQIAVACSRLRTAFPKMESGFFNLLAERAIANKFTPERLVDAVNNIIDNFQYKEINISDIIRYDRKIKLYTYNEVCKMVTEGTAAFSDFITKEINGNVFKIKKSDINDN